MWVYHFDWQDKKIFDLYFILFLSFSSVSFFLFSHIYICTYTAWQFLDGPPFLGGFAGSLDNGWGIKFQWFFTLYSMAYDVIRWRLIVFSEKATFYSNLFKVNIYDSSLEDNNILSSEIPSCFRLNGFFIVILNLKVDYSSRYGIQPSWVQLHQRTWR